MFYEAVTSRVVFVAVLALLIDGGAIVFAQTKSSTFYSTYDARELAKNRKYKGIDFAYGEMGGETSLSELPGGGSEKTSPSLTAAAYRPRAMMPLMWRTSSTGLRRRP